MKSLNSVLLLYKLSIKLLKIYLIEYKNVLILLLLTNVRHNFLVESGENDDFFMFISFYSSVVMARNIDRATANLCSY